ncbi:transporter [Dyella acidiphila]|uniref:Transporter n=1 Tax=Dyella acidiphila TaxID=2775866 RepID=A0ABR9GG22_9GAMM|nr:transporter [Dyella acidiphila]MBE1163002.1 transporter [Dyella acidiphila]
MLSYRPPIARWRAACHALAWLLLLGAGAAMADDGDNSGQTVPAYDRPAFGFGTSALPLGGFVIEQGLPTWSLYNQDGVRTSQFMTDSLLRVGLGSGLELQVGSTPFNWLSQRAGNFSQFSNGRGDTVLSLKVAPPSSSQVWSWGMLGTVEFPDGEGDLRLPQREYTLGVTVAQQLNEKNSLGYFAQWQRMGNQGTYQVAGNYGYAISKTWGVYTEAVGLHQQGQSGGLLGAGITYLPSARLQWDISFDRRFIGSGPVWMAGFGVAFYFGR